jgi:hypothetical protein
MVTMLAAGTANAGAFVNPESALTVNLGALPTITVGGTYKNGGTATINADGSAAGFNAAIGADIFTTAGLTVGTSMLTGVALISQLTLTANNGAGAFTGSFSAPNPFGGNLTGAAATPYSGTLCPSGCLGSSAQGYGGVFVVTILGSPLPFALSVIGVGGTAALPVGQAAIIATGGPFITGKARITNITTNVISIPSRGTGVTGVGVTLEPAGTENVKTFTTLGGFVTSNPTGVLETQATVTLAGTNQMTAGANAGNLTVVSPLRIQTGPLGVGNIPGAFTQSFKAVPEPGTALLLISGAAGLIFIGRKRMKS